VTTTLAMAGALLAIVAGSVEGGPQRALAVEVLSLAARGDDASLVRATALVPDPLRADPAYRSAAANRALARLLASVSLRERSATSPAGAEGLRTARAEREAALDELRPLARAYPDDPDVVRALAVYQGLGGRSEEVASLARGARRDGTVDPWIDYAETAAATRGTTPRESAALLDRFVADHPRILPARMSLVRARLAMGERDEALAAIDALLAVDPEHEDAKALKAELLAPPPVRMEIPVAPARAPPPSAPGRLPRKAPPLP
jgi:tetratricopeptide (TPR) repeat protein